MGPKALVLKVSHLCNHKRKESFVLSLVFGLLCLILLTGHCEAGSGSSSSNSSISIGSSKRDSLVGPLCPPSCGNGKCQRKTGNCLCNQGWTGKYCSLCGGKIRLNSTEGWLADAIGNYTVDTKCTWLIEAPEYLISENNVQSPSKIRLHLKEFATECGWDHLYVFDGDSVFSEMKAVFSGMVRNGDRYNIQRVPEVVGESGSLLVHFYSDVAYNMTGFNLTFSVNSCPSDRYELTCSGHGTCADGGRCQCDEDFKGEACNIQACPKNCEPEGVKRGNCNSAIKKCECFEGWTGEACSQRVTRGYWQSINVSESRYSPTARTSHSAMVDRSGVMWVLGGETFGKVAHSWDMVSTFTLEPFDTQAASGVWKAVRAKGDKGPSPRYGHSAVMHEDKIYMYGGTMRSGHTSKELWALDMTTSLWERVETKKGICLPERGSSFTPSLCGPIHSMGHTATVQSNRMIVIFGHSPKYGYLNTVQEYHFGSKEWSVVRTSGYPVKGGFGHSAAWDEITKKIYVFGGYVSKASTVASLSDELYSYDPIARRWALLSSAQELDATSATSRYLHSAVVSSGMMLIFGGNTHNDTAWSYGAKCFSADVIAYDILCDRWYNMQGTLPDVEDLSTDLARFGHSAVLLPLPSTNRNSAGNDNAEGPMRMLIYGGFNGLLKSDVISYVPGDCRTLNNKADCLSTIIGVKCVWDPKRNKCSKHPPNRLKTGLESTCPARDISRRQKSDIQKFCSSLSTCEGCTSTTRGCVWCKDTCRYEKCGPSARDGRVSPNFARTVEANQISLSGMETSAIEYRLREAEVAALTASNSGSKDLGPVFPLPTKATFDAGISEVDKCPPLDKKHECERHHICHSCVTSDGCEWQVDPKQSKCKEARRERPVGVSKEQEHIHNSIESVLRSSSKNRNGGHDSSFPNWSDATISFVNETLTQGHRIVGSPCGSSCSEKKTCTECAQAGMCMWCKNLRMCTDRNAYLASFPYGQCMDWTTQISDCPDPRRRPNDTDIEDMCYGYQTCAECREDPACGWCDDGSGRGVGTCRVGGASGPLEKKKTSASLTGGHVQWIAADTCSATHQKSWHFTSCPDCQCNGHSSCGLDGRTCIQPCEDHSEGAHCDKCSRGYYGNPVNGGECNACQCNGQAGSDGHVLCDHKNGRCLCTTKGVVGDRCQKCDTAQQYKGDPITSSCFYELTIDFQFTFNLSKPDDGHLTGINFKNKPEKVDVDVEFSITCSVNSKLNLTVRYTPVEQHMDHTEQSIKELGGRKGKRSIQEEKTLISNQNCSDFKHRFSKDDYLFGMNYTTFYVYVYDIETPMWVIISFSQHAKLDLRQFFITFSTCFLALLLVAAILWKIKQKYDRYRRRQRLFVEMEQMASRPFGTVLVELEKLPEHASSSTTGTGISGPPGLSQHRYTSSSSGQSSLLQHGVIAGVIHSSPAATVGVGSPGPILPSSSSATSMTVTAGLATPGGSGGGTEGVATVIASPQPTQEQAVTVKSSHVRRRKKRAKPSPIALEPCQGNRAAVLSLIVRLPTGGKPYAPNGCTGMAVASALVTLGNPRKPSAENQSKQSSVDDPKSRKGRKGNTNSQTVDI